MAKKNEKVVRKKQYFYILTSFVIIIVFVLTTSQNSCGAALESVIEDGIYREVIPSFYLFDVQGSRGFTFENGFYFDCDRGSTQGQNVNYLYCKGEASASTKYNHVPVHVISISQGGIVVEDFKINVDATIDLTQKSSGRNFTVVDLNCRKTLW